MTYNTDLSPEEAVKKVGELIKDIKFAMLVTTDSHGHLHSRPMTTQDLEFDGTLWFFINKDSEIEKDIEHSSEVNLSYSNPSSNSYVSICGTANLVDDDIKKKELWKPIYKTWFPEGLDDPKLTLLRVDGHHAQYWDTPSSIAYAVNLMKSVITGKDYPMGENQQITLY